MSLAEIQKAERKGRIHPSAAPWDTRYALRIQKGRFELIII